MLYFKYYVDVYASMTPFLRYTSSLLPGLRNGAVPTGNEPPFRFYTGTWRCICTVFINSPRLGGMDTGLSIVTLTCMHQ